MADTFHYIKDKKHLLKELGRVIKDNGLLAIIHTHEKSMKNIIGIKENLVKNYLSKLGINNIRISTDNNLLANINILNTKYLTDSDAYNVFASKRQILTNNILKNREFYFVSPHLDDAILSASFLIKKLRDANIKIQVITLFTKGSPNPYSPQAEEFIKLSGLKDSRSLFKTLSHENANAAKSLDVRYKYLNFIDAAFRKNIFGKNIYINSSEQFDGVVFKEDKSLVIQISNEISKYINNQHNSVFLVPLGIGGHVDHVIVRKAIEALNQPIIYWEDYPYNQSNRNIKSFFKKNKNFKLSFILANEKLNVKKLAIESFKSQMKVLFPNGLIGNLDEKYYTNY
jgi:LmbE family N-acetylglucosaminyl deacetylase